VDVAPRGRDGLEPRRVDLPGIAQEAHGVARHEGRAGGAREGLGGHRPQLGDHESSIEALRIPRVTQARSTDVLHRQAFRVHSFDVDGRGRLLPQALLGFLQEAAGRNAEARGVGMSHLRERGLAWMLLRLVVSVAAWPAEQEEVTVATWPTHFGRASAERDFTVDDAGGRRLAAASSRWAVVDLAARRGCACRLRPRWRSGSNLLPSPPPPRSTREHPGWASGRSRWGARISTWSATRTTRGISSGRSTPCPWASRTGATSAAGTSPSGGRPGTVIVSPAAPCSWRRTWWRTSCGLWAATSFARSWSAVGATTDRAGVGREKKKAQAL
jgi:acyl-CoA thioesterase FadM